MTMIPPTHDWNGIWPQPTQRTGWKCPECGSVWSPTTPGCFTCNKPKSTAATTGAGQ